MSPETPIIKTVLFIRRTGPQLIQRIYRQDWRRVGAGVLVLAVIGVAIVMARGPAAELAPAVAIHTVEIKSVAELSNETSPLSLVGQVTSKSEATVRAEHSGQIIGVYKALGDSISAGTVAAEIENASERAAILQAEGLVEGAQANLSKVTGGARSEQRAILESNLSNASASQDAARATAVNSLLSAYATADNAIHGTTDKMFTNPVSSSPVFTVISSDSQLTMKIESMQPVVGSYLRREELASEALSASSDLAAEIATTQDEVRAMRGFLDMIISALNKGIPTSAVSETAIAAYL